MANIVYYGGVGDPASNLKGALDYCVAQGYNTNGQETHVIQNGNMVYSTNVYSFSINTSTNTSLARYFFSNALYIENPNNYTTEIQTLFPLPNESGAIFRASNNQVHNLVFDNMKIEVTAQTAMEAVSLFLTSSTGRMLVKNCTIKSVYNTSFMFLELTGGGTGLSHFFNCTFIDGSTVMDIYNASGQSTKVCFEDCFFIGTASWGGCSGNNTGSLTTFKRCYTSLLPSTNDVYVSTGGIYTADSGTDKTVSKSNVPFNETTFFNVSDPTDPLYLVPRSSYAWGTIDQTTNIPENTVSKNGVTYTGSNRAVGCMALPDNVVEPILSPITKAGGNSVLISWTGINGGVIYTNEINDFATAREIATAQTGNSYTYEVPLVDRGKGMFYWVEVL